MKLMRKNGGFTLVELIVVIAILAILAGIAVPAYSGYIQKAEKAADMQLLGAVNTAFQSACMAEGTNSQSIGGASITLSEGKVSAVNPYNDTFFAFFEGNTDSAFKVIKSLVFDSAKGVFVDPTSVTSLTIGYGGGQFTVSGSSISAMKDSSFYGEGMTSEKLLNQVDQVAGIAGGMGSVGNVMGTEAFADTTLASLGYTDAEITGMTLAQKQKAMQDKAKELALKNLGYDQVTTENKHEVEQEANKIQSNALILYTAKSTTAMGTDAAKDLLKNASSAQIRESMLNGTEAQKEAGMNQAALAYGMYYAYVNSDACTDAALKAKAQEGILANDVINALDSNTEFKSYIEGEQGTKDMDAYLHALGVINSGTQDPNATTELVSKGFATSELIDILEGAMGK